MVELRLLETESENDSDSQTDSIVHGKDTSVSGNTVCAATRRDT